MRIVRHMTTLGFQLFDDQGQEPGVKDLHIYYDEFQEDDAWTTNNRELNGLVM